MMGGDESQPIRFSTEEVPEKDRLATWREVLGRVHLHLDVAPVGEEPLRATVESHRWAPTSLYFSDTTPVRAARTAELVQDGDPDFRLLWAKGAGYRYTAKGVDEIVGAGNGALLSNGEISAVTYLGRCQVTAIRVRRGDLVSRVRGFDDRAMRRTEPGSQAMRLISSYVAFLRNNEPSSDPTLQRYVAAHLADIVALAVGAPADVMESEQSGGIRAARLAAFKADVHANIIDPRLSADVIAERHGVTPRYVRKLFESEGLSVSEFVLEHRLLRAHRMLGDRAWLEQLISTIAFQCGFNDLSYFNRTFRRRFAMTPSDVRQGAQRERG
jgi:AraC-like DNA-binding protein